ncbi:MAG: outer membrane beta-barrel protein [Bacteroidales bacterium]|nr:outer membrane beta-barrel protein [Bacteroidales bacterium]
MKKIIIAAVALLCLCGTAAAQRHIEYKWRGAYVVVDGSYVMNLNRSTSTSTIVSVADTMSGFALGVSGGFQFRKEAGVGLGVTYLLDPTGAFTQMPIYAELRSHFSRSRLTPYAVLQLGYTLPLGASSPTVKIETGGIYFGAQLGGRFAIDRSFAIGMHVGYKLLNMAEVSRFDVAHKPLLADARSLHVIDAGVSLHF